MNKFKVGDTVKITREDTEDDTKYVGMVTEITEIKYTGWYRLKNVDIIMIESQLELVKTNFTKSDMQIGQTYLQANGITHRWNESDNLNYLEDLTFKTNNHGYDIAEVYEITPIWKRSEPKYRVKTELTKEQAEKLGLEFCEEVTR